MRFLETPSFKRLIFFVSVGVIIFSVQHPVFLCVSKKNKRIIWVIPWCILKLMGCLTVPPHISVQLVLSRQLVTVAESLHNSVEGDQTILILEECVIVSYWFEQEVFLAK